MFIIVATIIISALIVFCYYLIADSAKKQQQLDCYKSEAKDAKETRQRTAERNTTDINDITDELFEDARDL